MLKRISLIAVAASVAVLAIVATAVATPARSSATSAGAAAAKVTCGKVRSIGIATPITGPAASLGAQQLAWAQFYVSQWNKQKAHKKTRYTLVQGDTQLPNAAEAIKVAQKFASTSKILAVVGPAGSQEVQDTTAAFSVRRSCVHLRLRDAHRAHGRQPQGLLLPRGAERRSAVAGRRQLHHGHAEGRTTSTSSTTRRATAPVSPMRYRTC